MPKKVPQDQSMLSPKKKLYNQLVEIRNALGSKGALISRLFLGSTSSGKLIVLEVRRCPKEPEVPNGKTSTIVKTTAIHCVVLNLFGLLQRLFEATR